MRKHPQIWQKVGEMLDSGQMPPKDAKQPTADERNAAAQLGASVSRRWRRRRSAGDPGRVVLRRLSNAEYTYTLRDLTGVDSLDPAREFPVDGAAGEGFTNTGNALVMSPALVTKYLDAQGDRRPRGAAAGRHSLLAVTRRAATGPTRRSPRSASSIASSPTRSGGDQVNLQGIVFDTNEGGRLPLEKYLAATLAEREALHGRQQDHRRRGRASAG